MKVVVNMITDTATIIFFMAASPRAFLAFTTSMPLRVKTPTLCRGGWLPKQRRPCSVAIMDFLPARTHAAAAGERVHPLADVEIAVVEIS
jgi:hypothetical protein